MKKLLPVAYPPITSYTDISAAMIILWARKEKTISWISDHLIQLYASNEIIQGSFYDFVNNDNYPREGNCPFLQKYTINRDILEMACFSDFIERQINNNYYLNVTLDQYELNCSKYFQKKHKYHITFIYGYDSENELVYIADFYGGQKLTFQTISYSNLNSGFFSVRVKNAREWEVEIFLLKYVDNTYDTNIKLLIRFLDDYLNGIDSFLKYTFSFRHKEVLIRYGIEYYDMLLEHCQSVGKNGTLNTTIFHVLFDHKELMRIRLEYLTKIGLILGDTSLSTDFNNLQEKTLSIRNMVMKYNILKNNNIITRIIIALVELRKIDKNLTFKLRNAIH